MDISGRQLAHLPDLLTVDETAVYLAVSHGTVYELLREKKLAGIKVGGAWRIPASALETLIQGDKPTPSRLARMEHELAQIGQITRRLVRHLGAEA